MEYDINHSKHSQNKEPDAKPNTTEKRCTITKKKDHIDDQIKKVCKQQHQKHMYCKILIPQKM